MREIFDWAGNYRRSGLRLFRISKMRLYDFGCQIRNSFASIVAVFFILLSAGSSLAQLSQRSASDDRGAIVVRQPAAQKLDGYRSSRDYQYDYDTRPPDNPWAKFKEWFWRQVNEFFQSKAYKSFWQYVILAVIAGLVIWLLIKADVLAFMFPKKAQQSPLDYESGVENIHEVDFETAIEEAIGQRNFRLAIRLLYLQTLKRLTDGGLIAWKPDKTNRQYVFELINTPFQADFDRLTTQFEFVWYGDFPLDEARFQQVRSDFMRFNKDGLNQIAR